MIILLPSFNRTDVLPLVIHSIAVCDFSEINERILLIIVNHNYAMKEVVDRVVDECRLPARVERTVIHRLEAKVPIESWFAAIFSKAQEDEVICLLGDDDILLPWGLNNRYSQIRKTKADMLLTDYYEHIYFADRGRKFRVSTDLSSMVPEKSPAVDWEYIPAQHPNASFMSNHCYRNTKAFRMGLETAMAWCQSQSWIPLEVASGNCPFYMAYAIRAVGGSVMSSQEKNVLRGSVVEEAMYQEYADGGNSGFYALLIYDTFNNQRLHDDLTVFEGVRGLYLRSFVGNFVSILLNKTIEFGILYKTMKSADIGFWQVVVGSDGASFLRNIKNIGLVRWLRKLRQKQRFKRGEFKPVEDLLAYLGSLNSSSKSQGD